MRDQSPFARRSLGREEHRAVYDSYITGAKWHARRHSWAANMEALLISPATLTCRGCGGIWRVSRDDLHHCDYDRLGEEADDDLWSMCRTCHGRLHHLLDSFSGYKRMGRRQANVLALRALRGGVKDHGISALREAL